MSLAALSTAATEAGGCEGRNLWFCVSLMRSLQPQAGYATTQTIEDVDRPVGCKQ